MNKIDILHLSDLHLDSSNHRDLDIVLEALFQDLGSLKKNEKVSPDLVVFSGDLVKNGDIEENYTIVHSAFLNPLFKTLEIDQNRFFISPGNHDIQMSQIDEIYELGLEQKLVDRTEVNSFLDSISKNAEPFRRFSNFSKFKNRINSNYNLTNNILYSTYFAELKEVSVGLACMNSAWRASGKPNDFDRGRLLIGERQVDDAVKDIRDARIKIAVIHHPFEYLKGFDHPVVKRRVLTEFDIILMGHNHSPEPELSITGNRVLVNRAGCIYQSRDCYIGYSIVRLRIKDQQIDVIERQYYDDRRAFDKALHYSPEGNEPILLTC